MSIWFIGISPTILFCAIDGGRGACVFAHIKSLEPRTVSGTWNILSACSMKEQTGVVHWDVGIISVHDFFFITAVAIFKNMLLL